MTNEKNDNLSAVADVRAHMVPEKYLEALADFFKVLGDENRIKILFALSIREMCVNDLVELLGMSQSSVSHQLQTLRANAQVKRRKEGRNVIYSLDDEHVVDIFNEALQHVSHKISELQDADETAPEA